MKDRIMEHNGAVYTIKAFPRGKHVHNPAKFRVAVYRDGAFVGGQRTIADAEQKVRSGWWEPDPAAAALRQELTGT